MIVRPSGTEPKLKCYYEVISEFDSGMSFAEANELAQAKMDELIQAHQQSL
ncbi:phosphosugar mutase [Vibrio ishigakensis]|uniref:Phosphosugar mutase n=1 Tax=Vibrio ishigakensis TaxID=1481914 RepID=A0A0B8NYY0_9VIBR|nr:phosphosugar mutase [Vibrio ishigakensis]